MEVHLQLHYGNTDTARSIFHTPWVTVSLIFDPEFEPSNFIYRFIIIPADLFFLIQ